MGDSTDLFVIAGLKSQFQVGQNKGGREGGREGSRQVRKTEEKAIRRECDRPFV